jgi:TonB family protein
VKFSDGTKKSVSYDEGNGPPTIIALLEKITAIVARGQPIFKINMKPIKVVRAVYPATIKSAGIRQSVVVDVIIGKAGSVEKAKAVRGSQEFWGAATEAVKQWKWKPYLVNGRPALARTSVTVIFDPHR